MLADELAPAARGGLLSYDVVIPCFNRAASVGDAVASVLAQTHRPQRIIVVDDGSSDASAAVVSAIERREPLVQAVLLPRNGGASVARNAGLALARATWVAFLDSDDTWVPGAAEALLGTPALHALDVVVGRFRRRWPDGILDDPECGWSGGDIHAALARTGAVGPSWSLVRRSTANEVAGFDPSFHNCNDWDFYARVATGGGRFGRIDAVIAHYHVTASGRLSHDVTSGALNARRVRAALRSAEIV